MTQEELVERYELMQQEALSLIEDLREQRIGQKAAKARLDTLNLTFELLTLQQEVMRRIEAARDADIMTARRARGGKRPT